MIRSMTVVAASLVVLAFAAQPASALVFGGLETGSLTTWYASPWTHAGMTSELSSLGGGLGDPGDGWHATQGSSFAYLMTQRITPESGRFSMLSSAFLVQAGDRLEFDTFFDSGEARTSTRHGSARIIPKGMPRDGITLYDRTASDLADFGADGWTHVSHEFASAGSYQLEFAISADQLGTPVPFRAATALGFDDIAVVTPLTPPPPVPEPATLGLLGSALALVGFLPRRRRHGSDS